MSIRFAQQPHFHKNKATFFNETVEKWSRRRSMSVRFVKGEKDDQCEKGEEKDVECL